MLWLFVATTFTASALLFLVQPMFAKMALPRLGGSPAVWNTCVLFFQTTLLAGYLYTHLTTKWLGTRKQGVWHVLLMLAPLALLPLTIGTSEPPSGANPVWWLLKMMAVRVGLPFLVISTMAPLLQRWYATLPVPSSSDPYFLYAASNLGSMLSLLAYPFVLEPAWGVRLQTLLWSGGYVLLIVLTASCVWMVRKHGALSPIVNESAIHNPQSTLGWKLRGLWILLAFVPSSLMLGVTTHISTDLAPMPLLWVLPLAIYLGTFILAFATRQIVPDRLIVRVLPVLVLIAMASVAMRINAPKLIPIHLAAFFCCAMICHTRLARTRPSTEHLTEFYLWMSLGGMLGGAFNTLVATYVFNGIHEYPLMLALACVLRPSPAYGTAQPESWPKIIVGGVVPVALCVVLWAFGLVGEGVKLFTLLFVVGVVLIVASSLATRTAPFNALAGALALSIVIGLTGARGDVLFAGRSFFGVMKVIASEDSVVSRAAARHDERRPTGHQRLVALRAEDLLPSVGTAGTVPDRRGRPPRQRRHRGPGRRNARVLRARGKRLDLLRDRSAGRAGRAGSEAVHVSRQQPGRGQRLDWRRTVEAAARGAGRVRPDRAGRLQLRFGPRPSADP